MAATPPRTQPDAALPPGVGLIQSRLEQLYVSHCALEAEVVRLRATQPVVMVRPPRPGHLKRLLMRISGRLRRRHHLMLIRQCGLFDPDWYLARNRDVSEAGLDHGARDLRDPGPHFDTAHYLHLYPDIAGSGMNPLLHYIRAGHAEARSIRPGMAHGGSA